MACQPCRRRPRTTGTPRCADGPVCQRLDRWYVDITMDVESGPVRCGQRGGALGAFLRQRLDHLIAVLGKLAAHSGPTHAAFALPIWQVRRLAALGGSEEFSRVSGGLPSLSSSSATGFSSRASLAGLLAITAAWLSISAFNSPIRTLCSTMADVCTRTSKIRSS